MKEGIVHYVATVKKLFIAFSAIMLPLIMVSLVFAFSKAMAFWIISPVLIVLYLVVYALYALRVSMGTVLGVQIAGDSVHLVTKRKTFTYALKGGCVRVKTSARKFVATFVSNGARDKFVFLRRAYFSRFHSEQFTLEEMRALYPATREYDRQ